MKSETNISLAIDYISVSPIRCSNKHCSTSC